MEQTRGLMHNHGDVEPWPSQVPPGVPGAGWIVGLFFAFAVIVFTGWWWEGDRPAAAAPGLHHTTGVAH